MGMGRRRFVHEFKKAGEPAQVLSAGHALWTHACSHGNGKQFFVGGTGAVPSIIRDATAGVPPLMHSRGYAVAAIRPQRCRATAQSAEQDDGRNERK
jgi:hypothetical protein